MATNVIIITKDRSNYTALQEELETYTPMSDAEFADAVKRYIKRAWRVTYQYSPPSTRIVFKPKVALHRTRCNPVFVEVSMHYNRRGQMILSIAADICSKAGNGERSGQIAEVLHQRINYDKWPIKAKRLMMEILDLWVKYHNNDLHAGTPEQESLLREAGLRCADDYDKAVEFLKERNMYEVQLKDGTMYKYGTAWLTEDIPAQDQQRILRLYKIQEYLPES